MAPYDQFILFGDSLTQMSSSQELGFAFQPALQDAFIRRLDVINRGFSGYETSQAVVALPKFMPTRAQAKVSFMTIFFGANDSCLPSSTTNQHVPLPRYVENLKSLIASIRKDASAVRIILITPPPINEYQLQAADKAKGFVEARRTAEHTKSYADACRTVGTAYHSSDGVEVLDLWSIVMKRAGWVDGKPLLGSLKLPESSFLKSCLSDGLHFLPPAYKILYDEMMELIRRRWPDQYPIEAPYVLPAWSEAPKV